ncbi:chloride channel protein [Streptomyces sp. NPDC097619]|uniref:chloride channel protein n=1 Tax=Streptomyces sp. NPDC097619 TaxID=3157228 RepID=UPI00332C8DBA
MRGNRIGLRAFLVAAVGGALVGLIGGAFRWCLGHADELRTAYVRTAEGLGAAGILLPVGLTAAGAALACLIARLVPYAAGSGIQHVEAVWRRQSDALSLWLVPAKFVGGVVAIGSGLVLGREGPVVHMGASVGALAGHHTRQDPEDARMLHAALGGAGLAAAFTAPLGGLLFVCEEVTASVRPRLVLLTLVGTVSAALSCRLLVGDAPVLPMPDLPVPPAWSMLLFLLLGVAAGVAGPAYGLLVVRTLDAAEGFTRVHPVVRAAVIGAVVGALMSIEPLLASGGDQLSERLLAGGAPAAAALAVYFAVRFVAGPLSYAAGTPGGLFAPLLALGALLGALTHAPVAAWLPADAPGAAAFAAVGMAALFTGVVRAPLTGIVLVLEMTANAALLLPLLLACAAATLTATRLGSAPLYDTLRQRMLARP